MRFFIWMRKKYHPLFFLMKFKFGRLILSKIQFSYLKNSKKYGKFYIFLPRHLIFLFADKIIEKNTYAFIDSIIQSNNHKLSNTSFIDIGGNIGTYSFYFKKKYNTKILVFEPDEINLELLYKTKKKNNLENFFIFPFAVSNESTIKKFLIDDIMGATGTFSNEKGLFQSRMKLNKYKEIICLKLDDISNLIKNVSWVKIDVEGHEVEVISGMINLIKENQPNLIVESNETDIDKIKFLLKPFKYNLKKIDNEPNYIFFK